LTDWLPLLTQDKGSYTGLGHLINVGRNVEKLIPAGKRKELSRGEIFLLLSAVFLHDIGKIGDEAGAKKGRMKVRCEERPPRCMREERFQKFSPPCVKPYRDHHRRGKEFIEAAGLELGLPDEMSARYCGLLVWCHGLVAPPRESEVSGCKWMKEEKHCALYRNTSVEPLGTVRIPLLAGLLRIADETENHWTRALRDRWLEQYKDIDKGGFRRRVEDVEFCHDGRYIVMHLQTMAEEDKDRFARVAQDVRNVLKKWGPELRPLGIEFEDVLYEIEGKLLKLERTEEKQKGTKKITETTKETCRPMKKVLCEDDGARVEALGNALMQLSATTMGYREFPWASVGGKVGRPLTDRDKWLVRRMADWMPEAIGVDDSNGLVIISADKDHRKKIEKELLGKRA